MFVIPIGGGALEESPAELLQLEVEGKRLG